MWTNWKRLTLGALLLASMSLFLFGCGDYSGATAVQKAPVTKSITGNVSAFETGLPLANVAVTAYAVDATGVQATTPLNPLNTTSNADGSFTLNIPADYEGAAILEATFAPAKIAGKATKQASLTIGRTIRAALANIQKGQTEIPRVMISLATEMVVEYIEQNKGQRILPEYIQKATLVMETFLGQNFTQTPPPTGVLTDTKAQQDLVVMIKAFNSVAATTVELVKIDTSTAKIGIGTYATQLTNAITQVTQDLIAAGTLPNNYMPDPTIIAAILQAATTPMTESDLSDKTPPSAPTGLTAVSTASSVALNWTASTDNVGVTAYYVIRNGVAIATVLDPKFTDNTVSAATNYLYEVMARDSVGNSSAGTTINVTTASNSAATSVISGKVSFNGTGLAGVTVAITGSGSGTLVTDSTGNYTFTGVLNGTYTLTPTLTGYQFTPANRQVTVSNANVAGQDFMTGLNGSVTGGVTYPNGSVSGGVTYPNGSVTGGTTYPNGSVSSVVTYPNGSVTGGTTYPSGSVTGGLTDWFYKVYGKVVSPSGTGLEGVTVTITGSSTGSTTTDASGNYTFLTSVLGGSYSITPSLTGLTFSPVNSVITVTNGNIAVPDFTGQ